MKNSSSLCRRSPVAALAAALLVSVAPCVLHAQALPTVSSGPDVGFHLPFASGTFSWGVSASQTIYFGYNGSAQGGTASTTNVTGDLAYVSRSESRPFSMIYSGGYLGSETSGVSSQVFQNLSLSQVFKTGRNQVVLADTVSYLPQSPTVGLSGLPGLGDLGVTPVQVGGYTGPGILTEYQSRVSNVVSVGDTYALTGSTSLQVNGDYALQRFLGNFDGDPNLSYGLNSDQYGAGAGLLHRIDARNQIGVNYSFQNFTYSGSPLSFQSNGVLVDYTHRFTPRLIFEGSAGPQFSSGSGLSSTYTNAAVAASLSYLAERGSFSLAYSRGTNSGSGVVAGSLQDTVGFTGTHRFTRTLSGSTSVTYSHSSSLPNSYLIPYVFNTEVASAQVTKGIGRRLSVYGSYTIENQSTASNNISPLVFNGLSQILGFGITYSPGSLRFGY